LGFVGWLSNTFGFARKARITANSTEEEIESYYSEIYIREMCFWNAVNIIANAVSKCEFKTFTRGKEVKGSEYYLWNVEPNQNQNSSGFMHKLIAELYRNNECLVVEQNGKLLVADNFTRTPYALYSDTFTGVTVGDFTFNKTFVQSDVLYFKLCEKDMRQVINAMYDSYARLITYSMKAYQKSRGTKGIFGYETIPVAGTEERKFFDSLIDEKFKKFMSSGDAIIPLGKGQAYTDIGSKTYSSESTRDIRAMIDDISDFTAKGVNMPPALLRGDVQGTSDAVDQFLTFSIDPLVDMLQEEINRKRIGEVEYCKGTKVVINTQTIKHIDLFSISTAIDKLIGSGVFCINDIRKASGDEIIDEDWAWQHWITKNYSSVEDLLKLITEGEKTG
jgi:HK97 family phage portal protein